MLIVVDSVYIIKHVLGGIKFTNLLLIGIHLVFSGGCLPINILIDKK